MSRQERNTTIPHLDLARRRSREYPPSEVYAREVMSHPPHVIIELLALLRSLGDGRTCRSSLEEAATRLEGFGQIDSGDFACAGFCFHVGLDLYNAPYAQLLIEIGRLDIPTAPELTDLIVYPDGRSLLVTFSTGVEILSLERVKPDNTGSPNPGFSPDARDAMISDMSKLVAAGYYHPYAEQGYGSWQVDPKSGKIILLDWDQVERLADSKEGEAFMKRIGDLLV